MNLRVDFILDNEKRSASVLNVKSLTRIGIITVPVVLVVIILVQGTNIMGTKIKLRNAEGQYKVAKERADESIALRNEVAINNRIKKELVGWKHSHMNWYTQLEKFQRLAPKRMQFLDLKVTQNIDLFKNSFPERNFVLKLSGKAIGADAEDNVNAFINNVRGDVVFTEVMEGVNVTKFEEDTSDGANEQDRIFEIECIYKPKVYKEPRKKK